MEHLNYQPWISGAAQPKLTKDRLLSIAIAVAPREEQDRLMAMTTDETSALRAAIERARREVDLLREYRTRLVADVVTGKLDVREAAARLPETEEAQPGGVDAGESDEVEAEDDADVPVLDAGGEEVDA